MIDNTLPYWMALSHASDFSTKRKMEFLISSVQDKYSLQEALSKIRSNEKPGFDFSEKEWKGIRDSVNDLPNYAFIAERIEDQSIHTVNILDKYVYPETLKKNLGKEAPLLIYAKGNMDLIKKKSIAIVGSRNSGNVSLDFTENVAQRSVENDNIVVSGFAKGVDKKALDAALKFKGQSIIVLPQGIETYRSKEYYKYIVSGNVLVISIYHPKAPWSVGFAMDRNKIIYGLADDIYVAESGSSGGTWEGVLNGLKRGRQVFIRKPLPTEKNANTLLIEKGAIPVDMNGNVLERITTELFHKEKQQYINNKTENFSEEDFFGKLIEHLKKVGEQGLTIKEIRAQFVIDENTSKNLTKLLNRSPGLKKIKRGKHYFYVVNSESLL